MQTRLRELRDRRGLTLEQVADALGLRNQYVSNYELGKRRPDYETLKKFADFYHVTIDYILGHDEDFDYDQDFLRVTEKAKENGVSANELELALDFLLRAKDSDKGNR